MTAASRPSSTTVVSEEEALTVNTRILSETSETSLSIMTLNAFQKVTPSETIMHQNEGKNEERTTLDASPTRSAELKQLYNQSRVWELKGLDICKLRAPQGREYKFPDT
ncbi:hypothetical protein IV203_034167 [Nitzschia inconspicua]|uniref:Uncharacterized protein n=1 Tax=Nitzschia inconspicua TaxID=303405 RepID=A0A9K3M496_9STRA|nr:hypothetical protein IV203_034167 [Nitzschia inconspicua]